jgi:hypothetical protein
MAAGEVEKTEAKRASAAPLLPNKMTFDPFDYEAEWVASFAFVLAKHCTANGDTFWSFRTSGSPNREELLGALQVQTRILENELAAEWEST